MIDTDRRGTTLRLRLCRLWHGDPSVAEVGSGLALILWGLSLALPGGTFEARPVYYEPMANLAGEGVWAIVLTVLGAAQTWVATIPNRRCPIIRQALAFAAFCIWVFISATVSMRWPPSSGSMPHFVMMMGSFWAFARAGERPRGAS